LIFEPNRIWDHPIWIIPSPKNLDGPSHPSQFTNQTDPKWIEAKPIKMLDGWSTIKFFNEITVRYGVPHNIITDNRTNFTKGIFA
jgi:hypothetical protein